MTLEDVANQLLLPILSDVDPNALKLSPEEEDEWQCKVVILG